MTPEERLSSTADAFRDLNDSDFRRAAEQIVQQIDGLESAENLDPTRVEIVKQAVRELRSGSAASVGVSIGAALMGSLLGGFSHRIVDGSPKGIPVNGLVGASVCGLLAVLVLKDFPIAVRAPVAAFGGGFLGGSIQHVRDAEDRDLLENMAKTE